jgi:hypothetical protein
MRVDVLGRVSQCTFSRDWVSGRKSPEADAARHAAKLTQYLEPQIVTIYTTAQQLDQLLIENRLRQTGKGNIEILKRFWPPVEPWQYEDIVYPILVYADLLATGDERNIETARMIYERHIIRLVRED